MPRTGCRNSKARYPTFRCLMYNGPRGVGFEGSRHTQTTAHHHLARVGPAAGSAPSRKCPPAGGSGIQRNRTAGRVNGATRTAAIGAVNVAVGAGYGSVPHLVHRKRGALRTGREVE